MTKQDCNYRPVNKVKDIKKKGSPPLSLLTMQKATAIIQAGKFNPGV